METRTNTRTGDAGVMRCADMFNALGAEARLRIVRALLRAHPEGLVVGDIQAALEIPASTLSHHLERLKHEGLVTMERQSNFLRYRVNADALQELIEFLMKECCAENDVVKAEDLLACCPPAAKRKK
ncbi:MAG: metalloregulator ArsR/SmtB family transcription factor [Acidobacteria bacterium]|nr:metalloregulator ArsR/SmtB family transcription factor [Acidobacteriota bacterium]MDA1234407.1 metalloregulator ArsR/SmtB family transcription factor [Acidobacteriota bacterium]